MIMKCFKVGWLSTNCNVIGCEETRESAIIDPGFENKTEADSILRFIKNNQFKIKYIINTHNHPDHTAGNLIIKKVTNAPILIHKKSSESIKADEKLQDGDIIQIGNIKLVVLHTPGHTPDGICLLGNNFVFTGDSLFHGSIGRTDFPGGSYKDLIQSIKIKLLSLPNNFKVYPVHESFSNIGNEKKFNPFLNT